MTLEELQEKYLELEKEKNSLVEEKTNLTKEIETLKTSHEGILSEKEKEIENIRKHNSYLFSQVTNKPTEKEITKDEEPEETLSDILKTL